MTEFKSPNPNSKYSAHGSELIANLRVHHQGGLDTYCGFYAILNLVNFLKFKESEGIQDELSEMSKLAFKHFHLAAKATVEKTFRCPLEASASKAGSELAPKSPSSRLISLMMSLA
jgi:hypothetical protein